ncbi:hypothetical protein [Flavobacterium phycosphaerae]|uniref:hypothetical protein n=1 Tax=Flavobacterium phycosphaerae TaxID=2697515 RepID=UPI00138A5287|nr:hypothetical protein [Flavobacterium phycosphaerae]
MKSFFHLTLIILFFSGGLLAQNAASPLMKSDVFQDEYKNSVILLAEKNSVGDVTMVRSYKGSMLSQGEGFYIENYDANLKFKKAFDYEMKHPNYQKYNLILGVFSMKNNLHFIEFYYDLNEKYFVCVDNMLSEDFKTSKKELFRLSREEMKSLGYFDLQSKFYKRSKQIWTNENNGDLYAEDESGRLNDFHRIFFSGDGRYNYSSLYGSGSQGSGSDITLVINEEKNAFLLALDGVQQEKDGLKLYVFDADSNKKMDLFYTSNAPDRKCFFENIQLAEHGEAVYLVSKEYTADAKKKTQGGKYFFEFTKITDTKNTSATIDTQEHFIGNLKTVYHNNELIILGFYSDVKDFKYSGISCFKLDPVTLQLKNTNYNPFTKQFLFDKYGDKSSSTLKNISFKNVFFTENNDIIFNAEENYIMVSPNAMAPGGGMGGGGTIHFCYDDIVIAKLNPEGKLLWARNINKKQSTVDDDNSFISYTAAQNKDKTQLFLNTKDKIKKLRNDRIEFGQTSKNKSNLNQITINANGDFDYQEILDDEQNEVPFMVSRGAVINNSVYFLGRKGKNKQLLKITL